jgi:hypothetical protein
LKRPKRPSWWKKRKGDCKKRKRGRRERGCLQRLQSFLAALETKN